MSKPIYIYEGGGRNPHIIGTIDLDRYSDHDSKALYAVMSRRVNNVTTLEVRIPTNCEASKVITNTSDLVLFDSKGNPQEFHITEIEDIEDYSVERYIYAESTLGELINNIVENDDNKPNWVHDKNPASYLRYILSFSRWEVGTVDEGIYNSGWKKDLVGMTCLEALMEFIDKYNCEIEVRYTTDGKNKITGRFIDVKQTIGHNYGKRLEDDKDILGLKSSINLASVKTAVYPRIARSITNEDGSAGTEYVDISSVSWSVAAGDPCDKPLGQTVLVNPDMGDMFKRFNPKDGKLMERIMYAEWTGDTAEDAEDLCKQAWAVLRMHSTLTPSIELDAADLFRLTGDDPDYYHEQMDLGDTCLIVSKAFEPELRVETRVMDMEEDLLNPSNNKYAFGKYRRTMATSNIEQEKSVEDKLNELQNKFGKIQIPEPKPQYQSGRIPYEQIKEQIQNEFMTRKGYVMAEDSDGFWVMDAPKDQQPTRAIILKGGALGIAKYNPITASWEIGTFIDGTSVNADCINTGKLSADLFEAGSIRAEHLAVAAIEYIKSGLATEDELNGVIEDIKTNYVTNDAMSDSISDALKGLSISTRNILNRSNVGAVNNDYMVKRYTVAELFTVGEEYTITLCTTPAEGVTDFSAFVSGGSVGFATLYVKGTEKQVVSKTFKFQKYADGKVPTSTSDRNADVCLYRFPNNGTVKGNSTIHWCVITKGNKEVLAWIPSPEDTLADIEDAVNKGVLDAEMAAKLNAIKDLQRQVKGEYESNLAKANTVYADQYLPAGSNAKTELKTAIDGYTSAYNVYYNHITEMMKDAQVTTEEYNTYVNNSNKYATALKVLSTTVEKANNARLENVYAQARQGLITKAELEVNNNSVIAKAQQGMVSTGAMTEAISFATKDLVNNSQMNGAINNAVSNKVSTDKLSSEIIATKIDAIKQTYKAITTEYLNNKKQADTLYTNSNLNGTAKTNLNSAISDYSTKYNAVTSAYNDIVNKNTLTVEQANLWNTSIASLQTSTTTLAQRMQEAVANINTNIYNSSKSYSDELKQQSDNKINGVSNAVTNLNNVMNGSFRDSVINEAEAIAIGKHIDTLNTEKANIDKEYEGLYNNINLKGDAKSGLANAKNSYNSAHNSLITTIRNAIADKNVTTAENNDINSKLSAYNTSLGNYRKAVQTAIDNIASNKASNAVSGITLSSRNILLKSNVGAVNNEYMAKRYKVSELFTVGEEYTVTLCVTPAKGVADFAVYVSNGSMGVTTLVVNGTNKQIVSKTFVFQKYADGKVPSSTTDSHSDICLYRFPNNGTVTANSTIYWCVITKGNKGVLDWIPAPEDNQSAINEAVKDLASLNDVDSAKNNAIIASKVEVIKQTYNAITTEYKNNSQQANTLYNDKYLSGTAKTNLNSAKTDYTNKYNALTTAYNNIASDNTLSTAELQAWNTAITNLQGATVTLAIRIQEAMTYINTAIYNASKDYTDKTIPDKLTGYAKTSYVDTAKQEAIKAAKEGMVTDTQLQVNTDNILMMTSKMGQYNLMRNTDLRDGLSYWSKYFPSGRLGVTELNTSILRNGDEWCMAGERALQLWTNTPTATGFFDGGAYQVVRGIQKNVSYTLSQWTAAHRCSVKISIVSARANGDIIGELASKYFENPSIGGRNRKDWDYSSISFTAPSYDFDHIKIHYYMYNIKDKSVPPFMWIIKPMLCTGINAQAWTGHPDEMYIGVVSVTEENGIKVEHNHSNTYSTLDAGGLKIWEHNNSNPIASFGEGNSAFIGTLNTKKLICDTVTPTVTLDRDIDIYYSSSGSGDKSGRDSGNCAAGFTGAMRALCNMLGIDTRYVNGGFNVRSGNPYMFTIALHAVGTALDEGIFLENIGGTGILKLDFPRNMIQSGLMYFNNIQLPFEMEGNRSHLINNEVNDGCLLKRTTETYGIQDGIMFKHCSSVLVQGFRITSNQDNKFSGISFYYTKGVIKWCDVFKFRQSFWAGHESTMYSYYNLGFSKDYGIHVLGSVCYYEGAYPRQTSAYGNDSLDLYRDSTDSGGFWKLGTDSYPFGSNQGQASITVTSKTVTSTFSPTNYISTRSYSENILYQSSWGSQYGDWVGKIYFGSGLHSFLQGATNIVAQVYLQRKNTQHGQYSNAKVRINGTEVGTLSLGEGKWFNVPSNVIEGLKSGALDCVTLDGKGKDHYIQFELNASIWVQCTKRV